MNVFKIGIDEIEPNLFLGNWMAAVDVDTLKIHKITHILTIEEHRLPQEIMDSGDFVTKHIVLRDNPDVDIISLFNETEAFILEGVSKGAVFVHCLLGRSRSASAVLAYIMKKHQLTYEEAYQRVYEKRPEIQPNDGFVSQLKLYHEMGYQTKDLESTNHKSPNFKMFKLRLAKRLWKYDDSTVELKLLIKDDPVDEENVYFCKNCHRVLASESNQLTHETTDGETCTHLFFIEPLAWMNVLEVVRRKDCHSPDLLCPKCTKTVGFIRWDSGFCCGCGFEMDPAFCLQPAGVGFGNVKALK